MEFQDRIATSAGDRDKRIAAYLARLDELKGAGTLREVLEERMFLEFIRLNKDRINEYPLLEVERHSVTEILLRTSGAHPGREFVKDRIANFLVALGRYGKTGDGRAAEAACVELVNAETILLKCVQGVVYSASLIKDNFSDAVIRHFGEASLGEIERITESFEFDESYWRAYVETFIKAKAEQAFAQSVRDGRYAVSREGGFLAARFFFDEALKLLPGTDKEIQKTRIQRYFEERRDSPEGQQIRGFVGSILSSPDNPVTAVKATPADVAHAASIAAIDAAARAFLEAFAKDAALPDGAEEAQRELARRAFVREQLLALCVGASMAAAVARRDFPLALKELDAREAGLVGKMTGNFESDRLEKVLLVILEFYFLRILRDKAEPEGGKIQIRTVRTRRTAKAEADKLEALKLNRIRRRQIWDEDPDNPDMLLFKSRTIDEFRGLLELLHLEEDLRTALQALWVRATFKTVFLVLINLAAVGKVTTNLPQRIAEILALFGVAQNRSAGAA